MDCLDANVVQDLMSGALDANARAAVMGHLDTCEDCRELLGVTAADTLREHLVVTKPYSGELRAPRLSDPALGETMLPDADIGLDATRMPEDELQAFALDATAGSRDGVARTLAPADRLIPPRRPATGPIVGMPFGRYTLTDRLGAGAMGVVWRASDPKLGRHVALKLLRRHDATLTDRLIREAQSMAQVSHPNVVAVYDVGFTEGNSYIAMELVEGTSLRAWQTAKSHTVPEIVAAYVAAGRGLAAAHAAGIVHRDFKPDNVLVGTDGRARVTDFGLAAAKVGESGTHEPIGDVALTTAGSVLGTPAYMAPEQFSSGNVDSRTDQFNFCVALYEALYEERPFEGKTFRELGDTVIEGRVKPPPTGTQVSSALRAILLRGLATKPGDRFASMDHLLAELVRDRARPWRRTAIAAAALAAALALGLVSDWAVRGRVASEIHQSFALTGKQLDKTLVRLHKFFATVSQVAYREQALREVAGHHDQADFGLGTPEADRDELEKLHNTLVSVEWVKAGDSQRAIVDYKGRLLYTSYAPQVWNTDMHLLPPIKRALDAGKGDSVTVLAYNDPAIAATQLFGSAPPRGIALMFARTLALGDTANSEARAIYLQLEDGKQLLDDLEIDDKTLLALIAPDGTMIGDEGMTHELAAAAPPSGSIVEVDDRDHAYQVQARAVPGLDGVGSIAQVVMARKLDGVLTLFPNARLVFLLAALGALGVALATAMRARQITGARV